VVLFEPNSDDAEMFFTNMFSYASRRRLCEHAYQKTRIELYRRRHELGPILARHGIRIRLERSRKSVP
jgi:NTE family protein